MGVVPPRVDSSALPFFGFGERQETPVTGRPLKSLPRSSSGLGGWVVVVSSWFAAALVVEVVLSSDKDANGDEDDDDGDHFSKSRQLG